jgi:hypothetical protein
VRADLAEGEDAVVRPAATVRRQVDGLRRDVHQDDRRAELARVSALRIGGLEAAERDVLGPQRLPAFRDEPRAALPRRGAEHAGARAERGGRDRGGGGEPGARDARRAGEQPAARDAVGRAAQGLGDRALGLRVAHRAARLDVDLLRQDALAGEDQRGRRAGQRAAEQQPEDLRVRAQRHGDREARAEQPGGDERQRGEQLGARVPRQLAAAAVDRVVVAAGHVGERSPMMRATPTSTSAASSQATIPSGIGPRWPMPQPPASSGWRA